MGPGAVWGELEFADDGPGQVKAARLGRGSAGPFLTQFLSLSHP